MSLKASKSFVIDADVVKAYDIARDFFLTLGYSEQSAIRPTLLILKKRGSFQDPSSSKTEDYRISLRVSFNPVGDLQLYSTALLTVRAEYEVRALTGAPPLSGRTVLEKEIEWLKSHLTKTLHAPTPTATAPPIPPEETIANKLPGRVATGYSDLDNLLLGGIPENYAVVLASPSSDERDLLIKKYLEAGGEAGQITFYITVELGSAKQLAEKFQSNFYIFVCNPRAESIAPNLPNVFKLKGVENLTELDIALIKAFRELDPAKPGPKRICMEIISDVLLQHHAVITRRWLSGLLPDLKSKGFTTLAVANPHMHPQEEMQAILGLFEGEIRISEKETEKGIEKTLRIRKLYNQRYLKNELTITRERLES